ncbi:N-acetylmuramoyl-L-alanine amidase family protein [Thermospira aquatica]|uniref:N-acetylmuramoyl-L-alanine amidase n=1 Tax=Thermospira aquatica TaxID=2828656 RepID=A0AAX3BCW3_9SPIR|nr:N-acetylmuramoyl-L-alanine amidase [Thermospira aquatica]URA10005.1 N-acetylmuramoyl-L-alanine amidase [Thermospira aquatica]
MRRGMYLFISLFSFFFLVATASLEDLAREYTLSLRYDWNLGYAELRSLQTNRFCRVYMTMPYVVFDGKVYYLDRGMMWEKDGRMVLSDEGEELVRRFARAMETNVHGQTNHPTFQTKVSETNAKPLTNTSRGVSSSATNTNVIVPVSNNIVRKTNTQKETNISPVVIQGQDLFRPIRTVILDPGHGGKDPGGIGKGGVREKDLVLEMVFLLKKELETLGYRVILTRGGDKYLSLSERVEFAYDVWQKKEGALFVSVHGNISLNAKVRGIEIYYLSDKASDAGASAVEIAENAGFSMDDVKHTEGFYSVLNVLMREGVSRISYAFARDVKTSLSASFSQVFVKSANFYVLRFSPLPALLWEVGYLSHPKEVKLLQSKEYQLRLVKSFAKGLDNFVRRYNARRGNV